MNFLKSKRQTILTIGSLTITWLSLVYTILSPQKMSKNMIVLLLLIMPLMTIGQDSTTLRLKLKAGQAFDMIVGSYMQMDMKMDDTTLSITMEMEQQMRYNVMEVKNNGDIKVGTTPESSKSKMSLINGMSVEYDSKNPNLDDPTVENIHNAFSTTIGRTINMTMSPLGEIKEYHGLEQYFEELIRDEPGTDGLRDMFRDESLKELMDQFAGLYPENVVNVGDTWKTTLQWKQFGMEMIYDYTLLEIKDGVVKIGAKGKIDVNLEEIMENMTKMVEEIDFEYEMIGNFDGSFELNATDGWIDNMIQNVNVTGFMKMKLPEGISLDTIGMNNVMMDENDKVVIPMDLKLVQTMKRKQGN